MTDAVYAVDRRIVVTFAKEGIHCYPEAATNVALADVKFLSYPHRHIFHHRVELEVFENNRDVEFIQFKRWLESLYDTGSLQLDYKSCEMMAEDLIKHIITKYPNRTVRVEVSEDNENTGIVTYKRVNLK